MPIRIVLADDHKMFRKGLTSILSCFENMDVIAEAENGAEALRLVEQQRPDVLLLDLNMPLLNGFEVLEELKKRSIQVKVIVISMHEDDEHIIQALTAGAHGYLCKNADPEEIENAINSISKGNVYFNERTNNAMLKQVIGKTQPKQIEEPVAIEEFSDKEMKILQHLADGLSNAEIASSIYASVRTVENLRYSMMKKLGVSNGMGLLIYAIKNQLVKV